MALTEFFRGVYCKKVNFLKLRPQPLGSNFKIFRLKRGIAGDFILAWVKEVQKHPFQKYSTELLAIYMA